MTTLAALAELTGTTLHGDGACVISGVETLECAESGHITFLTNRQYRKFLPDSRASAIILKQEDLASCATNALISPNPYLTYAQVVACFAPATDRPGAIHQNADVHPDATVADTAYIASGAIIGSGSNVGDKAYIGANCVIGEQVSIGAGTRLVASVNVLDRVSIGENCLLHPGVVIGSDGFGLANDEGRWIKIAQLGSVVLEDDVEIGANTTIDRGAIHDTIIRKGAKLDNQIQIAHNVEIGEHTAIAACTGISGSTRIGSHCTLAGGVGIVGHIELADGVHVSGASVVSRSLRDPGVYTGGILAMPHKTWQKNIARIKHLDAMARRLRSLEQKVEQMTADASKDEQ